MSSGSFIAKISLITFIATLSFAGRVQADESFVPVEGDSSTRCMADDMIGGSGGGGRLRISYSNDSSINILPTTRFVCVRLLLGMNGHQVVQQFRNVSECINGCALEIREDMRGQPHVLNRTRNFDVSGAVTAQRHCEMRNGASFYIDNTVIPLANDRTFSSITCNKLEAGLLDGPCVEGATTCVRATDVTNAFHGQVGFVSSGPIREASLVDSPRRGARAPRASPAK